MSQALRRPRRTKTLSCLFCQSTSTDEFKFGGLKSLGSLHVHYYCLLFSATIEQLGEDHEGILGFLLSDILKERDRGRKSICVYCHKSSATLKCANKYCRCKYHLPCGLLNDIQLNFNNFKSSCDAHRTKSNVPDVIRSNINHYKCIVCMEYFIKNLNKFDVIWANCCRSEVLFHVDCIQNLAYNAGYFTKCPNCNNDSKFIRTIKLYGVFVPERDASWELDENAFSELYYVHETCDVAKCLCPYGRKYNARRGSYMLVLCPLCGSFGAHAKCSPQTGFVCPSCNSDSNNYSAEEEQITNAIEATSSSFDITQQMDVAEKIELTKACNNDYITVIELPLSDNTAEELPKDLAESNNTSLKRKKDLHNNNDTDDWFISSKLFKIHDSIVLINDKQFDMHEKRLSPEDEVKIVQFKIHLNKNSEIEFAQTSKQASSEMGVQLKKLDYCNYYKENHAKSVSLVQYVDAITKTHDEDLRKIVTINFDDTIKLK